MLDLDIGLFIHDYHVVINRFCNLWTHVIHLFSLEFLPKGFN